MDGGKNKRATLFVQKPLPFLCDMPRTKSSALCQLLDIQLTEVSERGLLRFRLPSLPASCPAPGPLRAPWPSSLPVLQGHAPDIPGKCIYLFIW